MSKHKLFSHLEPLLQEPWVHNENIIWLTTTVKLARNIEKFIFPNRLDTNRKTQLMELIVRSLTALQKLKNLKILTTEQLLPLERDYLSEHFLLFDGLQDLRAGDAFVCDNTGLFIALINIKDHLQLQFTDCAGDIENTWKSLVEIENELGKTLTFAFSNTFGFLTQDPIFCGTGLTVSAYLHLPALIHLHRLQEMLENEKADTIHATGLQGNPDDLIGDILLLRNAHTLGLTEENIISSIRNVILNLVIAEKNARSVLKAEHSTAIKDRISRALGILKFSYQLDTVEALSELSLVKLGIELGYIRGMTVSEINKFFFNTRRAHLCTLFDKETIENDLFVSQLPSKRAELLREKSQALMLEFS